MCLFQGTLKGFFLVALLCLFSGDPQRFFVGCPFNFPSKPQNTGTLKTAYTDTPCLVL